MGEVQRHAQEARLKLLETQLEPHMLFNTLANLRALIAVDAERAQQMLDPVIAYLRATLHASRAATHPLQAEFDRLRDYLKLMAIRMGPRLAYALELPPALAAAPVPVLLLQPLVENSIKHGLEPKVQGGRITVRAQGDAQGGAGSAGHRHRGCARPRRGPRLRSCADPRTAGRPVPRPRHDGIVSVARRRTHPHHAARGPGDLDATLGQLRHLLQAAGGPAEPQDPLKVIQASGRQHPHGAGGGRGVLRGGRQVRAGGARSTRTGSSRCRSPAVSAGVRRRRQRTARGELGHPLNGRNHVLLLSRQAGWAGSTAVSIVLSLLLYGLFRLFF